MERRVRGGRERKRAGGSAARAGPRSVARPLAGGGARIRQARPRLRYGPATGDGSPWP
jgi:hypothetical protein